ncbi:MAG: Rpn family recombination-promoting nuclease/putative transposase [Thermodesulfobacteria bacterium]|nr:Rpn family recombination-promoting nuclease/putative transposase [Thermodesulfobacteriota bacterium]
MPSKNQKIHIYFLFEHKSSPDKFIFVQILSYISALWEECLKRGENLIPVIPIVFYHGERK